MGAWSILSWCQLHNGMKHTVRVNGRRFCVEECGGASLEKAAAGEAMCGVDVRDLCESR